MPAGSRLPARASARFPLGGRRSRSRPMRVRCDHPRRGRRGAHGGGDGGQAGARVLVIDHADRPGKKILISGGGRCNFTNTGTEPGCFLSENPHFAKSALSRYTQWDFIALVDRHGIAWHEKTLGQLFCDGSAREIVAMLMEECRKGGVEVRLSTPDRRDRPCRRASSAWPGPRAAARHRHGRAVDPEDGGHGRGLRHRPALRAEGRPAAPGAGAADAGRGRGDVPRAVGRRLPGRRRGRDVAFEEAALFTHKGLSGPAILQVSSYWSPGRRPCR
jgi:hypothetical protein